MTRYLVLLRGINVGGRNKVPMAALRELLELHGPDDPASNAVILRADLVAAYSAAGLARVAEILARMEKAIALPLIVQGDRGGMIVALEEARQQ